MSHSIESFAPPIDIRDREWIVFDPEQFACTSNTITVTIPPLKKKEEEPTYPKNSKEKLYNKPESLIGQLIHYLVQKRLCDGAMPESETVFVDFQKFLHEQTKGPVVDGLTYVDTLMISAARIANQMAYEITSLTPTNTQWISEIPFGPSTSQMRYINKLLGFAGSDAIGQLQQDPQVQELAQLARTSADFRLPIEQGEYFLQLPKNLVTAKKERKGSAWRISSEFCTEGVTPRFCHLLRLLAQLT